MTEELTQAELADLKAQMREYGRVGRPEMAALVRGSIERGEQFFAEDHEAKSKIAPGQPPFRGKGSGGEAWQEFARSISDLDEEIITSVNKDDLVRMLYANGLIESYRAVDVDADSGGDGGGDDADDE